MSVPAKVYDGKHPAGWAALLPCPFCDAPARITIAFRLSAPNAPSNGWAECTRCGASAGCIEITDQPMTEEALFRWISRAWNRRGRTQNAAWKLQRIAAILGSDFVEPA